MYIFTVVKRVLTSHLLKSPKNVGKLISRSVKCFNPLKGNLGLLIFLYKDYNTALKENNLGARTLVFYFNGLFTLLNVSRLPEMSVNDQKQENRFFHGFVPNPPKRKRKFATPSIVVLSSCFSLPNVHLMT